MLSLISSDDDDKHNLAADCQQWQVGIGSFKKMLAQNDMLPPFLIPEHFDLDEMSFTRGPVTNLIDGFHDTPDGKAQL